MKKVSTVGANQIRNVSQQNLTISLDLGDRSSWYCVLDEAGTVVLEQKLSTTPKAMKADAKMKAYPNLPAKDLDVLVAYLLSLK